MAGHLILMRDSDRRMEPGASALVLGVGGDTLICVAAILEDHKLHRPMSLDLLWQVDCSPVLLLVPFCLSCMQMGHPPASILEILVAMRSLP